MVVDAAVLGLPVDVVLRAVAEARQVEAPAAKAARASGSSAPALTGVVVAVTMAGKADSAQTPLGPNGLANRVSTTITYVGPPSIMVAPVMSPAAAAALGARFLTPARPGAGPAASWPRRRAGAFAWLACAGSAIRGDITGGTVGRTRTQRRPSNQSGTGGRTGAHVSTRRVTDEDENGLDSGGASSSMHVPIPRVM